MAITVESLLGRVIDCDSHEQIPTAKYPEVFGERGARFMQSSATMFAAVDMMMMQQEELEPGVTIEDTEEINEDTVWTKKGLRAPSHADMDRRPAVLDAMGIQRQLVFPSMALFALSVGSGGMIVPSTEEEKAVAWEAIDAYNDWAAQLTSKYPDRLWVAGVLPSSKPDLTIEDLMKETERLIGIGAKSIFIPTSHPPAGLTPADPFLDPWYELITSADVALVTHPPGGHGFTNDRWPFASLGLTWVHMAEEHFLSAMTLGGVFERHPSLRFGVIEAGASWVGPLAEFMDFWVSDKRPEVFPNAGDGLTMKPSEYLARNVRVTPFNYEDVATWIQRYPHLQDVYCYASDYPHPEGQVHSLRNVFKELAPLGDDIVEKYFCTNGALLCP